MTRNQLFRILSGGALSSAHWMIQRRPTLGLRMAGSIGALAAIRPNSWRAPSARKLIALLGPMTPASIRRTRLQIASLESRNEALGTFVRRCGVEPLVPLVTAIHAEPLLRCRAAGVPIVLVSWHQGPLRAISLALRQLGVPALFGIVALGRETDDGDDTVRHAHLPGGVHDAGFLKRALRALAEGTVLGLNLDCAATGLTVPLLSRQVLFGRGAAALTRLGGARLMPVTRRFQDFGWRMEVTFHEPVDDADLDPRPGVSFDQALLARAAQRFDAEARQHPGSLRPGRVDWLIMEPHDGAAVERYDAEPPPSPRSVRRQQRRRDQHRDQWEKEWGSREFNPAWVGRGISPEIREAVASGWLVPGSAILDAGCGEGDVTAWLARCGYRAVGADIAEAAIARARQAHEERPGVLDFMQIDLCQRAPDGGPFQAVVDRGCFHQIVEDERRAYAARLISVCSVDARLLVFARAFRDGIEFGNIDEIRRRCAELMLTFGPYFELERFAPTYLDRYRGTRPDQRLPGMVFWLRRRPSVQRHDANL